jgi:alkylation response protein AidB-like acyl-CoA dehydrogenase
VPKPGATHGKGRVRLYEGGETDLAVLVEPDRARLYAFPDGSVTEVACLDKSIAMAEADWADATLVAEIEGDAVARRAGLALAAMQGGTAEAALAMIVEYAKIRSTFGRPIGAYQAVRHPCSDMAVRVEAAKAQLLYASVAVRDGFADAVLMIDAARAVATEAAIRNVDDNIQLHGGIGITEEHDAHLLMKRATVVAQWLGSDRMVLDRIAAASVPGTLAA